MQAFLEKLNRGWVAAVNYLVQAAFSFATDWSAGYYDTWPYNELVIVNHGPGKTRRIAVELSFFRRQAFWAIKPFAVEDTDDFTIWSRITIPYLINFTLLVDTRERWRWVKRLAGEGGNRDWGIYADEIKFIFALGKQYVERFHPNGDQVYLPSGPGFTFYWKQLHGKLKVTDQIEDSVVENYHQPGSHGFPSSDHEIRLMLRKRTLSWPRWWKPDEVRYHVDIIVDTPPKTGGDSEKLYNYSVDARTLSEGVIVYRQLIHDLREWNAPTRVQRLPLTTPKTADA